MKPNQLRAGNAVHFWNSSSGSHATVENEMERVVGELEHPEGLTCDQAREWLETEAAKLNLTLAEVNGRVCMFRLVSA